MRCPNCGFENMPGPERCIVCDHELTGSQPSGGVRPPRARDRSFMDKAGWSIENHPTIVGLNTLLRNTGRGMVIYPGLPWLSARAMFWAAASIAPGLGHICVMRRCQSGMTMLLGSLLALMLAVILYQTIASDMIVYGLAIVSAFSMWSVIRWFRGNEGAEDVRLISDFGIALMVIAVYFAGYFCLRIAVSPLAIIVKTVQTPAMSGITAGDDLLLLRNHELKRGDVIIGDANAPGGAVPILGTIVGMPGDRIELWDRIYVNGSPTQLKFHAPTQGHAVPLSANGVNASILLEPNTYWVAPMPGWQINNPQTWISSGIVQRPDVWGRVAAITGPPEHRRRFN